MKTSVCVGMKATGNNLKQDREKKLKSQNIEIEEEKKNQ